MANPVGRPTDYTEEIANEICEHVANGGTLVAYTKIEGKPKYTTIMYWLRKHEDFAKNYTQAQNDKADYQADLVQEIAFDDSEDHKVRTLTDQYGTRHEVEVNKEAIGRSRLKVDTLKWIVSKQKPKKYGDFVRTEVTGADGEPVFKGLSDADLDLKLSILLAKVGTGPTTGGEGAPVTDAQDQDVLPGDGEVEA